MSVGQGPRGNPLTFSVIGRADGGKEREKEREKVREKEREKERERERSVRSCCSRP